MVVDYSLVNKTSNIEKKRTVQKVEVHFCH